MDDAHSWYYIVIFLVLIGIDFVFFAFGAAIQNLNATQTESRMEAGDKKAAKVLKIYNRPTNFVNAIQIMATLLGFITGYLVVEKFTKFTVSSFGLEPDILIRTVCVLYYLLCLILIVSIGIIIPKRLAMRNPAKYADILVNTVSLFMICIAPLIFIINLIAKIILKFFSIDMDASAENVTEEDIMSMVNEGHEQGILESSKAKMITNIFELNDKTSSDVMMHRKGIVYVDGDDTLKTVVDFMLSEGSNSRYPVYGEDIDDIIGILNLKDALILANKGMFLDKKIRNIKRLLRKPYFIPETMSLDKLFKHMQSNKIHMAIVVDEYGQTAGLVTMEDILEEIVGNILDEYDVYEELIIDNKDGTYTVRGMAELEDVAKLINIEFTEEELDNFETLNGFIVSELDRIPNDGEKIELSTHGYLFKCDKVENRMIDTVLIEKNEEVEEEITE